MDSTNHNIGCSLDYLRTIPGILKIIELLCDILGTILAGAAPVYDSTAGNRSFYLFVSILALIITFVLLILGLLNVHNVVLRGRWPIIELCWCLFICLFYFIAGIVIAVVGKYHGAYGAAAFFGFAAMIVYGADAFFQFRTYRGDSSSPPPQQYAPDISAPQRPPPTY
ncbi:unnamed protein product [Adineta ricciae]|uniref:MARVEL domain-containing protein n=1 Tax=Adineta ricciae TaxID=249248 RepID=A0A815Q2Z3_ADIRI|nr:unnamed protein product [Adineta ricciae]